MRRVLALTAGLGLALTTPAAGAAADSGPATPFAGGQAIRLLGADRPAPGKLRLTMALENPGKAEATLTPSMFRGPQESRCPAVLVTEHGKLDAGAPVADQETRDCYLNSLAAGQGEAYAVLVDDPGGSSIDIYPGGGLPLYGVPVAGEPSPAATLQSFAGRNVEAKTRVRQGAATVKRGTKVSVDLQTDVLFDLDKATLTPKANAALDVAAKTLEGQPGRSLAVTGYTDSQGADAYNMTLSQKRAQAVRTALGQRLGSGWTFAVSGKGESSPAMPEEGLSGADLKAAQQANRRVTVEVQK